MTPIVSDLDPSEQEWKPRRVEKLGASVFDLDIRDVEAYQDEPLTWNTVVADCSSYDSATTENDGEVDMQGKRRSACCLHSNLSDADWIADAKVLLLNWSATTLRLLSSFAGTFLRCRWWITSVDDHVGHNNVVPERIPVPSRTTIPQDATKCRQWPAARQWHRQLRIGGRALPCLSMNDAPAAKKSATNIGEITFGGPILMLSASTTLVSATKKHLPKVWGGHGPCGPPGYAIEPGYAERLSISKYRPMCRTSSLCYCR